MSNLMHHRAQDLQQWYVGKAVEIDVRMRDRGEIVVCHDPDKRWNARTLDSFLMHLAEPSRLAINIKEDGIMTEVYKSLMGHECSKRSFFFDMSIPQLVDALRWHYPVAFRLSDLESLDLVIKSESFFPKYSQPIRFWIDCFKQNEEWQIAAYEIVAKKFPTAELYVVSPELHKLKLEDSFIDYFNSADSRTWVCTDEIDRYEVRK